MHEKIIVSCGKNKYLCGSMNCSSTIPGNAEGTAPALLTVVIPVYNRAGRVLRTLDSIAVSVTARSLPYQVKMIVVDNASTDGSLEVVRDWGCRHDSRSLSVEVISEDTPGAAAARNAGLRQASTPWVMHFDSDDMMSPMLIGLIHDAIQNRPDAQLLGWPVSYRMPSGYTRTGMFTTRRAVVSHLYHATLATLRYAVRRDLLESLSSDGAPWDEDMRVWDDYVLGCRLLMLDPVMVRISRRPMADVAVGDESISGTGFSAKRGQWEAALERCREILPQRYHRHLTARRAILCGLYIHEDPAYMPQTPYRLADVLEECGSRWQRMVCRCICRMAASGIPGPGRLASLLLR